MSLLAGLPAEIKNKINKTKQTRGAQPYDRVPYQNRVNRTGVALVPYAFRNRLHPAGFQAGYRIMVKPKEYFTELKTVRDDFDPAVVIGTNAFIYYDNKTDWTNLPVLPGWQPCTARSGQGHYLARVPGTTSLTNGGKIVEGEPQGIRFFEYATQLDLDQSVAQLAWLAWMTVGIDEVRLDDGVGIPLKLAAYVKAADLDNLQAFVNLGALARVDGEKYVTICPLCREQVTAHGMMTRLEQAEGREISDLTVTEINLFHLEDLRPGEYNHQPYKLAWGHHHCNTVAKDSGVPATVNWMRTVMVNHGYQVTRDDAISTPETAP